MKQIIQDLKNGETILEEVPVPQVKAGYVLIKTSRSLVSLGTERMLVEFGKANLIDKARQQPDKVKQVLDIAYKYLFIMAIFLWVLYRSCIQQTWPASSARLLQCRNCYCTGAGCYRI